jgi:hypothetical protein
MEENYVAIFSRHIGKFLEEKKFDINDAWYMVEQFKSVCEKIYSREDLLNFLEGYIGDYPEFNELKSKLLNKEYIFKDYI